MMTEDIRFEF